MTELQTIKTAREMELAEKATLSDQLSLTESRLHESLQLKSNLEKETKAKSELELKVRDLEVRLADKTRFADSFEDERKQRLELEKKVADINLDHGRKVQSFQEELQKEKQLQYDLELKVQDLEQMLEEVKVDNEALQQSMKIKVSIFWM